MPEVGEDQLLACLGVFLVILILLIIFSIPRTTIWIEHCPFCHEELKDGSESKDGTQMICPGCGNTITRTKPHD